MRRIGEISDAVATGEPLRLVNRRSHWYLMAWDTDRSDWRTFRLDRISRAAVTTATFRPHSTPTDDLPTWLDAMIGEPRHRIIVTLHASLDDAVTRLQRIDGELTAVGPHRTRYDAEVDSFEWLTSVLVLSGLAFTIETPGGFADYIRDAAMRLGDAVSGAPDSAGAAPGCPE